VKKSGKEPSLTNAPMFLCRVSWLRHYDGRLDDPPFSNHRWVTSGRTPYESKNFLSTPDGYLQGFVQVRDGGRINIDRLRAEKTDTKADGITVVWCAQHPAGLGLVVVGWYNGATVFRERRKPRDGRSFETDGEAFVRLEALTSKSVLLDATMRNFVVQPKGAPRGSVFGQSDLCYVDKRLPELAETVRRYIATVGSIINKVEQQYGFSGEPDPERNEKVEKAAIRCVADYYKDWDVKDRQSDYCGWDLEARRGKNLRCIEVKGRSPAAPAAVRLSPNEERAFVRAMSDHEFSRNYRLAIVHDALGAFPTLRLLGFNSSSGWVCEITGEGLVTQSAGILANPTPRS
jgi:Domain of unknown function (DUF3883)